MNDLLSDLLDRCQPPADSDESMERLVWKKIAQRRRRRVGLLCAAAGLLMGAGLSSAGFWLRQREDRQLQQRYLAALDLQAAASPDALEGTLRWMKDDLKLTPEQFARVQTLHRGALDQLIALHREIDTAQRQATALEDTRRQEDRIDFLASESVSEHRHSLGQQGSVLVSGLVQATAAVLTEDQRRRYEMAVRPSLDRDDALAHD